MLILQNIHYHPPTSEEPILRDLCLKSNNGKITIVSGPSGSGKTTLLELICGLLIPSNGKIAFYDKENFKKDINISELITYVPQEPYLVDSDFFDNVTMFDNKNILKFDYIKIRCEIFKDKVRRKFN